MRKTPFGIGGIRDTDRRDKEASLKEAALLERRLAEYREELYRFNHCLDGYAQMLDEYGKVLPESTDKLSAAGIDAAYLKEQGERALKLLEEMQEENVSMNKIPATLDSLSITMAVLGDSIKGMDRDIVNRLSEQMVELQKQSLFQYNLQNTEHNDELRSLKKKVQGGNRLLWVLFILLLINMTALAYILLKDLGLLFMA